MAVEKYGSKTDMVVKLVLVFFISLLSFSIGTFVGKKFSDNQHKISQLEPMKNHDGTEVASTESQDRDVASVHPDSSEVKPKDALSDDDVKKLAEEFLSDDEGKKAAHDPHDSTPSAAPTHKTDKNSESHDVAVNEHTQEKNHATTEEHTPAAHAKSLTSDHAPVTAHAPAAHSTAAHSTAAHSTAAHSTAAHSTSEHGTPAHSPSEAANRVVAGKTPEPEIVKTHEKSRIPQSLPKEISASAVGKFTVQVASYPTESEAEKLATDLKNKGFSAFYVSAKVKDKKTKEEKTWYRVSVGLFATQKEAELYKNDLLARAKVTSAIVQKITE